MTISEEQARQFLKDAENEVKKWWKLRNKSVQNRRRFEWALRDYKLTKVEVACFLGEDHE